MTPLDQNPPRPTPRRRSASSGPAPFAALDLGTNNCRLLIARPERGRYRVLEAFSRVVRLGEGLEAHGSLSAAAIERSIEALKICATRMRRRNVREARCVATEACRRASNARHFVERVAEETGVALEIIGPEEEARLAVSGCAPLFEPDRPWGLVFDIGGGSTEFSFVDLRDGRPRLVDYASFPLGVVGLTERYGGDRLAPGDYEAMVERTVMAAADFAGRNDLAARVARGEVQVIGTSGTVTTLAGMHMGLTRYDRSAVDGVRLGFADAIGVARRLAGMDRAERAAQPCIGADRAELVVAGCAIMEAVHRHAPVPDMRVGDRGLREGVLFDFLRRRRRRNRNRHPLAASA